MDIGIIVIFFVKQKTADEMLRSLVGSEMCIRDRLIILKPKGFHSDLPSGMTEGK